jgi:hypothetical protein
MPPAKGPTPRDIGCVSNNGQWTRTEYGRTKSSRQLPEPIDRMPVEQPTKFDLAVKMKTAKALGPTIPEAYLLRAREVID